MRDISDGAACDKDAAQCKDGDKPRDNPSLPTWARLSVNRCNLPAVILGSLTYQENPSPLEIDGVPELHRDFFRMLHARESEEDRVRLFYDYMSMCFRLDALEDAGYRADMPKNRGKLNYLKLIRGWHFNSDSTEGAVLKSWVESRFGLLPRYHGAPIRDFSGEAYTRYLEHRSTGLYNTNALESQLDLLYTYTQTELARRYPDRTHFHLYRGVNRWESYEILGRRDKQTLVLLNNVNSFSEDADRAGEFGDRVIAAEVPLTKIICCAEVLPGKLQGEGEALVMGGVYSVRGG